mgnify:FL=1
MNYYDDLSFVNWGYTEKASNSAQGRLFEGYYGVQYLHKGPMYASTGDNPVEYAEGPCVFITYPGVPFHYGSPPGTTRGQAHLCFCGPRAEHYCESGLLTFRPVQLFRWLRNPEQFFRSMCGIHQLLKVPGPYQHARAVLQLEDLLLQLQEQPAAPDKLYSHYVTALLSLRDRIAMDPLREWDFRQEARRMELSYVHFRRIFKQATAWPPGAFLLECRLRHAEKLLMASHARVSEIAQECGFRDAYHFSRIFRKHCGHSPVEFRRLFGCQ